MTPPRKRGWGSRVLKILLTLPFLFWLYTRVFWPSTILDAPEIAANFYAKEMCSCLYVVGQTEAICRENTRQWIAPSDILPDPARKRVNARVYWALAQAKFYGDAEGCRIDRNPTD